MRPLALSLAMLLGTARVDAATRPFLVGADLSSLPQVEAAGAFPGGNPVARLRACGFNAVRLRYWHVAPESAYGRNATLAMARRIHAAGMSLVLDLHESNTWADPLHQSTPAAWRGLAFPTLLDSVQADARAVVGALAAQGTPPALVQVGNEIDAGMLWPAGMLDRRWPRGWPDLAALIGAATRGVHESAPEARIAIHVSHGGDEVGCRMFCDELQRQHVDYDVFGVSFYPWWGGTFEKLEATLRAVAARSGKDVMVLETAYPWTLRWFDGTHNAVGRPGQLLLGMPATPEGQAAFARRVRRIVRKADRGAGVFFWEPARIAGRGVGSPWENCALFDTAGALLPAARAFAR